MWVVADKQHKPRFIGTPTLVYCHLNSEEMLLRVMLGQCSNFVLHIGRKILCRLCSDKQQGDVVAMTELLGRDGTNVTRLMPIGRAHRPITVHAQR